jgi:hypothetical protein
VKEKMDIGAKLEHTLRHLKNPEPALEHWMEFGDVGRSAEVSGVLLNSGAMNRDLHQMVDGLALAVYFLAKMCTAMERRIASFDTQLDTAVDAEPAIVNFESPPKEGDL